MKYNVSWLPKLIEFDSSKEDLNEYIEKVYKIFVEDYINQGVFFKNEKLGLKRIPLRNGKEATFYHIVSEGEDEENRAVNLDRCARIRWAKAILESNYVGLKIWENKRRRKKNILVWFTEKDYLVVIRKNPNQKLFWTAYPVTREHTKEKLEIGRAHV